MERWNKLQENIHYLSRRKDLSRNYDGYKVFEADKDNPIYLAFVSDSPAREEFITTPAIIQNAVEIEWNAAKELIPIDEPDVFMIDFGRALIARIVNRLNVVLAQHQFASTIAIAFIGRGVVLSGIVGDAWIGVYHRGKKSLIIDCPYGGGIYYPGCPDDSLHVIEYKNPLIAGLESTQQSNFGRFNQGLDIRGVPRNLGTSISDGHMWFFDQSFVNCFALQSEDVVIISSDGLFNQLESDYLSLLKAFNETGGGCAKELFEATNNLLPENDIRDDITTIYLDVHQENINSILPIEAGRFNTGNFSRLAITSYLTSIYNRSNTGV